LADIRWQQRLENFQKAFQELSEAMAIARSRELSKLEKQGLIQSFEYTHELAWNTLKDFFVDQGNTKITGSKDATREGFKAGLLENGEAWMDMITSHNQSSHTYNKQIADSIVEKITSTYFDLFEKLIKEMTARK